MTVGLSTRYVVLYLQQGHTSLTLTMWHRLRSIPSQRTSFIFPTSDIRTHTIPILFETPLVAHRRFSVLPQYWTQEVMDHTYATDHRHFDALDQQQCPGFVGRCTCTSLFHLKHSINIIGSLRIISTCLHSFSLHLFSFPLLRVCIKPIEIPGRGILTQLRRYRCRWSGNFTEDSMIE